MSEISMIVPLRDHYERAKKTGGKEDVQRVLDAAWRLHLDTQTVFLAIPAFRSVEPETTACLMAAVQLLERVTDWTIRYRIVSNTYLEDARNQLANEAAASFASVVIWIDADMIFPPEAVLRLANEVWERLKAWNRAIVRRKAAFGLYCAPYPARGDVPRLTIVDLDGNADRGWIKEAKSGRTVDLSGAGLGFASSAGMALSLLPRPVFRRQWVPEAGGHEGEDLEFCRALRNEGGQISGLFDVAGVGHIVRQYRDVPTYLVQRAPYERDRELRRAAFGDDGPDADELLRRGMRGGEDE